jgi:hypothetical protein
MKIVITESQYKRVINEGMDSKRVFELLRASMCATFNYEEATFRNAVKLIPDASHLRQLDDLFTKVPLCGEFKTIAQMWNKLFVEQSLLLNKDATLKLGESALAHLKSITTVQGGNGKPISYDVSKAPYPGTKEYTNPGSTTNTSKPTMQCNYIQISQNYLIKKYGADPKAVGGQDNCKHHCGYCDGKIGEKTKNLITQFQNENKLKITSRLDTQTWNIISKAVYGRVFPRN